MTLEEAIEHCEERANKDCSECSKEHAQLAGWLKELKELRESAIKDLEEAAKDSGQRHFPDKYNIWARPNYEAEHAELAFKEGANWQREQMMKDAVDAVVDYPLIGYDFPNIYPNYRELKDCCDKHSIKDSDKVKIIIIKEE